MLFFFVRPPSGYIIIQITEWYSIAICEICVQGNVENISMGVSKFQYFFNSPIVRRRWVCLSEEGWVQPLFCFVLSTFSISHGQGDRRMILQEFFFATDMLKYSLKQGLIHKRLNKVCDSFEMLCSNCLNHWEYLLWKKGLGTKLGKLSFTF